MSHVFTYGSLMFAPVWTRVVTGEYRSIAATLVDHARFAVRDQDYPGMIVAPGSSVDGLLYLEVGDDDIARLDDFEGGEYRRITVPLSCADGVARDGDTYLYLLADRLLPSPWSAEAFAMERFLATYCVDKLGP